VEKPLHQAPAGAGLLDERGELLRRSLSSTNAIESCLSTVQRVARNVKRWQEGNQVLRWRATGLLEPEKRFNRIKGYRQIGILNVRLNPLIQQEVRKEEIA
jgi:putative transposase